MSRQRNMFESVSFLNDDNYITSLEFSLQESSSEPEVIQEILKFANKDDIPNDFEQEVISIIEFIRDNFGKAIGSLGIINNTTFTYQRFDDMIKRIKSDKIKNNYIIGLNAKKLGKKFGDDVKLDLSGKKSRSVLTKLADQVANKFGYENVSKKPKIGKRFGTFLTAVALGGYITILYLDRHLSSLKSHGISYIKEKGNYIYNIDVDADGSCIYLRCLKLDDKNMKQLKDSKK